MGGLFSSTPVSVGISANFKSEIREVPMSQNPEANRELGGNEEYRRLEEQHHEYENRLQSLTDKLVLSDEEQVEENTLKKRKCK